MEIKLNESQQKKAKVIKLCAEKKITTREVAFELGLTMRAVQKIVKNYKKKVTKFLYTETLDEKE